MTPDRPLTNAQVNSYAAREIAKGSNAADIAVAGINTSGAVLRELISCAKANPIVGVVLAAVVVDVLGQTKVIRPNTEAFLMGCIGVAFGVSVSLEALDGLTSILSAVDPFKTGGSTAPDPADLIKPVPTTIVENPPAGANASAPQGATAGAGQLAALIPKAIPE